MNGHPRKRGSQWEVVLEHGEQAGLRCPACVQIQHVRRKRKDGSYVEYQRERGTVYWPDESPPESCPTCGGRLVPTIARRQELLRGRYPTKKLADRALHDELRDREQGDYVKPSELTVGDYLRDRWLPTLDALELRPNTKLAYRLHVEKRIIPKIGGVTLQSLTYSDVVHMHARLASEEGPRGHILSPATRRGVLAVLHKALAEAVRAGLLRTNPAEGVRYPKVERRRRLDTWDTEELDTFLRASRSDRLLPLWILLAKTGMRRGEALGLWWSDIDLDTGSVYLQRSRHQVGYEVVEGPLKGGDGRRVHIGAGTVAALRSWKARQASERLQRGPAWTDTGHVFTRADGRPWHPNKVTESFGEAVKAAGVKRIRVHDLRHTHATLWLKAGGHPKVLQERLGHKSIKITMDTYSHALPTMQEGIADVLDATVYTEAR
ncbi:MAG: site-specific integrase [Actinobacteria bacterium]|nr:site-specific integrase [Actinomycetota bacterium]